MAIIRLKYVNGFRNKKRRDARVRYYVRVPGCKSIPLPGRPGSEEFNTAYALALAAMPKQKKEIGADRTLPGSINALVVAYYKSEEWLRLANDTHKARRPIIERFRIAHGDKRVATLDREAVKRMLAKIEKPSAKNSWLKAIRGLLQAAVPLMRKDNPAEGIAKVRMPKTKGRHSWTDEEIAQYRAYWPLGTQERLVQEFALE